MQKCEAIHQSQLRTELLGVLNEFKQAFNSTWSSQPPKSSYQFEKKTKAQISKDMRNFGRDHDTKSTNKNSVSSNNCPEDGEHLGKNALKSTTTKCSFF